MIQNVSPIQNVSVIGCHPVKPGLRIFTIALAIKCKARHGKTMSNGQSCDCVMAKADNTSYDSLWFQRISLCLCYEYGTKYTSPGLRFNTQYLKYGAPTGSKNWTTNMTGW